MTEINGSVNGTAQEMERAGKMSSELIRKACQAAQDEIRKAVQEVQNLAFRINEDSVAFTSTLMEVGEEQAQRIEQATGRLTELINVIDQQKHAVAQLCVTTPFEAIRARDELPKAPQLPSSLSLEKAIQMDQQAGPQPPQDWDAAKGRPERKAGHDRR